MLKICIFKADFEFPSEFITGISAANKCLGRDLFTKDGMPFYLSSALFSVYRHFGNLYFGSFLKCIFIVINDQRLKNNPSILTVKLIEIIVTPKERVLGPGCFGQQ